MSSQMSTACSGPVSSINMQMDLLGDQVLSNTEKITSSQITIVIERFSYGRGYGPGVA